MAKIHHEHATCTFSFLIGSFTLVSSSYASPISLFQINQLIIDKTLSLILRHHIHHA
jgi:hypothetical protein